MCRIASYGYVDDTKSICAMIRGWMRRHQASGKSTFCTPCLIWPFALIKKINHFSTFWHLKKLLTSLPPVFYTPFSMRTAFALIAFVVATVTAQSTPYYITAPIQGTSFKAGDRYVNFSKPHPRGNYLSLTRIHTS